jgi:hypothetical protein
MSCPPDDGQSVRGDDTGTVAVADVERLLQDHLDVGGEGRVRVIGGDESTSAKEMGQTGLMSGGRELSVRCPAIAAVSLMPATPTKWSHMRNIPPRRKSGRTSR